MIAIPLMTPGEKLRQLREQQPKRVTRADVADALNERNKLNRITVAIIRDIEMGLSAKWLPTYIDFAISQWGADRAWIDSPDPEGSSTIPVIQESSAAYHTLPLQLLPLWQGTPLEYDLEFRPTKKYIRAEVNLPDSMEEYFAAEVFGTALSPRFPHGSTLIFRRADIPPDNSIVLVESPNQSAVLRGFGIQDSNLLLFSFSEHHPEPETKLSGQKFLGYAVAHIDRYNPARPQTAHILYNRGEALLYRP